MKRLGKLWWVPVLALMFLLPATARGEMYLEVYAGGNFAASTPDMATGVALTLGTTPRAFSIADRGAIDPAVVGGLKLGTWFVPEGFLGFNYPRWMKYLGFYLDFSYHRLNFANQPGTMTIPFTLQLNWAIHSKSEGNVATLAFMFAARYGFLPDAEVPFGRLQPYVAVGPALMFASQQPTVSFDTPGHTLKPNSNSLTTIALAAEGGLRWMALKNVSLDVSFKYRWAQPSFSYATGWTTIVPFHYNLNSTYHLFSFQLGAAYHF